MRILDNLDYAIERAKHRVYAKIDIAAGVHQLDMFREYGPPVFTYAQEKYGLFAMAMSGNPQDASAGRSR